MIVVFFYLQGVTEPHTFNNKNNINTATYMLFLVFKITHLLFLLLIR